MIQNWLEFPKASSYLDKIDGICNEQIILTLQVMICAQRKFGKEVIYTTVNSKTTIITTKREIYFRINKQTQKLEKCILELTFGG